MISLKKAKQRIKLVRYDEKYLDDIYKIYHQDDRYLWSTYRDDLDTYEFRILFNELLKKRYHIFRMILNSKNEFIGFIYSYDFDSHNLHVKVTCYIASKYRNIGYGPLAALIFFKDLFDDYPLHKIECHAFHYNHQSNSNLGKIFNYDGCLKDHIYYKGEFHSIYIYSLIRSEFLAMENKIWS